LGTAKAAVVVVIMMVISLIFTHPSEVDGFLEGCQPGTTGCTIFTLTNIKDVGMPKFHVPAFNFQYETCGNSTEITETVYIDFMMMAKALGTGILVQPIISYLEIISLAKTFARKDGYLIDATQEFVALGAANTANSFIGGFPISAGMSRSTVNYQADGATQLSGIIGTFFI